jgi:hypothetical protein
MKKYYSVMIKGRTLESRDIRELLARAVNEKRKSERIVEFQSSAPVRMHAACLERTLSTQA